MVTGGKAPHLNIFQNVTESYRGSRIARGKEIMPETGVFLESFRHCPNVAVGQEEVGEANLHKMIHLDQRESIAVKRHE